MDVPGHEEIELALVKLYQVTGEKRYLDLARFFLDNAATPSSQQALRPVLPGPHADPRAETRSSATRFGRCTSTAAWPTWPSYSGDQGFIDTMDRLWDDVVERKMYVTGGIGARHEGEAFGDRYELPNDVGLLRDLRGDRHGPLEPPAEPDARRRAIRRRARTGALQRHSSPASALDGKQFFYVNPLASDGKHHRQPFFACACCPTNVVRVLPSLPGYVYAQDGKQIFVNLYIAGTGNVPLGDGVVAMTQETRYPWDGAVKLTVAPKAPAEFAVNLRIPGVVPRARGWPSTARRSRSSTWTRATPGSIAHGSRAT